MQHAPQRFVTPSRASFSFASACVSPPSRTSAEHCTGCSSAWLEHCVRDAGVAGSNPVTPTISHDSAAARRGIRVRRALRRIGAVAAVALPLALAGVTSAAPPQGTLPNRAAADAAPSSSAWVADELRILRADVESLRQRPDASAAEVSALRSEVAKLAAAQADLERRLGVAPAGEPAPISADRSGGVGVSVSAALVFLLLGAGLG